MFWKKKKTILLVQERSSLTKEQALTLKNTLQEINPEVTIILVDDIVKYPTIYPASHFK